MDVVVSFSSSVLDAHTAQRLVRLGWGGSCVVCFIPELPLLHVAQVAARRQDYAKKYSLALSPYGARLCKLLKFQGNVGGAYPL